VVVSVAARSAHDRTFYVLQTAQTEAENLGISVTRHLLTLPRAYLALHRYAGGAAAADYCCLRLCFFFFIFKTAGAAAQQRPSLPAVSLSS